ncbi:DUF2264 domain-containing protein [Actinacidiphila paucisporea]|uniref:DUF2264 domain-containing protein n=1 Tax=Actinacidiphila paucisporea TaxID=310782 RepID=UPI0009360490|nr:DUF2264 domain-containing protein [Actinacidiphila paucisporea]
MAGGGERGEQGQAGHGQTHVHHHQWRGDLGRYLDDAVRLIGADGSSLMQGRSLTYRYAAAAPLWVAAVTGAGTPAPGLVRRAASGMLRHFTDAGSLEPDGLLRLGWTRPWPQIAQSYSGPGCPYWAAKGMLGLMLPADHPAWRQPEQPLPVEEGDVARVISAPGWLVSARKDHGIALVVNHGTDHAVTGATGGDSPLYARSGYSTATLPALTGPSTTDPLDNSVVVLDPTGRATHRSGFETLFVRELPGGVLAGASRGRVRWIDTSQDDTPDHGSGRTGPVVEGPVVTVASVVHEGLEVRVARLDDIDGRSAAWRGVRLGGWPVADDEAPSAGDRNVAGGTWDTVNAEACTGRLLSRVTGLRGFTGGGTALEQGTGPLARWTAVPWLAADPAPVGEVLAASVFLGSKGGDVRDPDVLVEAIGDGSHRVTVRWTDGRRTDLTLPAPPGR